MKYAVSLRQDDLDCFPESMWTMVDPPWTEELLTNEIYQRQIIEVDDKYKNIAPSDFDEVDGVILFNEEKYNQRMKDEQVRKDLATQTAMLEVFKKRTVLTSLPDKDAYLVKNLYDGWTENTKYEKDDRFIYEDKFYKVLQAHTSEAQNTPGIAPSLYVEISDPNIEYP